MIAKIRLFRNFGKREYIALAAILFVATLLRISYVAEYIRSCALFAYPSGDSQIYSAQATAILSGDLIGNRAFYYAPLYGYFLALVRFIFMNSSASILYVQSLLGLLSLYLIYRLGRVIGGSKIALLSCAIGVLYGPLLFQETKMLPTTLSIFLLLLAAVAFFKAINTLQARDYIIAGLLVGLAVLARPHAIILLFFCVSALMLRSALRSTSLLRSAVIYAFAALLVISVATVRNYLVSKDFVPVSYNGGITFYQGNNPQARGAYTVVLGAHTRSVHQEARSVELAEKAVGRALKPSEVSSYWFKKGLSFIVEHPFRFARLEMRKIILLLNSYELVDIYSFALEREYIKTLRIPFLGFGVLAAFGLVGAVVLMARSPKAWPLHLFSSAQVVFLLLFYISGRYRMTLVPFLIVYAAVGVDELYRLIRKRLLLPLAIASILICTIMLVSQLKLHVTPVVARTNLAFAFLAQGKTDEAIAHFTKATHEEPNYVSAWRGLGDAYSRREDFESAISVYDRMGRVIPHMRREANSLMEDCLRRAQEVRRRSS